jgi:hypothetical protein
MLCEAVSEMNEDISKVKQDRKNHFTLQAMAL